MKILIMGGTRFVGVALTKLLVSQGHEVVLFNRGNRPAPVAGIRVIHGDRTDPQQIKDQLAGEDFDAIFDNNARELQDAQTLIDLFTGRIQHYVYMSSAGVYLESEILPHVEGDATDPQSRHKGKLDTESYLQQKYQKDGFPFTAIRPTYIYGPQNYNDIEAWFFDRICHDRPLPIPDRGLHITQLGHVSDLGRAMAAVLGKKLAVGQIYNVADPRYVTFLGLARACATVCGKPNYDRFVFYDAQKFGSAKRKAFPLRVQHFFTAVDKAMRQLDWQPEYDLLKGLETSYKDYVDSGRAQQPVDFSLDDQILASSP
ncbi:MAG: NAD-dependent epimerase/dehydratase family protein [Pseudanabaenaceae cyanobacterium]